MSEEDASELLKPYSNRIFRCFDRAWAVWLDIQARHLPMASRTHRANVVHAALCEQLRGEFTDVIGVRLEEKDRFLLLTIEDRLCLRFKKFDDTFRTRSIPTQQSLALDGGQIAFSGFIFPLAIVGYRLTKDETALRDVSAVLRSGDAVLWQLEIERPDEAEVIALPAREAPARERRSRVKGKESDDGKKRTKGD